MSDPGGHIDYAHRLDSFRKSDSDRDNLIQEVITALEDLKLKYTRVVEDHQNEQETRRLWQNKAKTDAQELLAYKQSTSSNAFAVALIDGDGALVSQ